MDGHVAFALDVVDDALPLAAHFARRSSPVIGYNWAMLVLPPLAAPLGLRVILRREKVRYL